jgi:hypothetical protein
MSAAVEPYIIPGTTPDPYAGRVGASLEMPYTIHGPLPLRLLDDVVFSIQKHLAYVLDTVGAEWLVGRDMDGDPIISESWEVRTWSDESSFRLPFARVAAVGPDTITGRTPLYADHSQSMTVHLYPQPAQDAEHAILAANRLSAAVVDAIEFGIGLAAGATMAIPLWDFQGAGGDLYADSAHRLPPDFIRVVGLTAERMLDPEDDRFAWVVLNFRAQWRRARRVNPGLVVQSVRMAAHPE